MKFKLTQNGEWHWLTGGIVVSLLSIATYVLFNVKYLLDGLLVGKLFKGR